MTGGPGFREPCSLLISMLPMSGGDVISVSSAVDVSAVQELHEDGERLQTALRKRHFAILGLRPVAVEGSPEELTMANEQVLVGHKGSGLLSLSNADFHSDFAKAGVVSECQLDSCEEQTYSVASSALRRPELATMMNGWCLLTCRGVLMLRYVCRLLQLAALSAE